MSVYSQAWRGVTDCTPFGSSLSATLACSALTKLAVIQLINHAINKSLHPNRLVASSFIRPSRFGFQVGLRLYPLPNSAITGGAGDNGFIQRNGWFGRHCRQTVKLSDFVSHPRISVEGILCDIPVDEHLSVFIPLPDDAPLPLLDVSRSFFADRSIHAIRFCSLLLRLLSFDFSLCTFFAHIGQYFEIAEPGIYSTPHTIQFFGDNAVHRFVGVICNSPTKPMNL